MNKSKINKILIILIIVNIILGIVLFLSINKNNKASNQFTLEGEQEIIVGLGAKYKDPGFLALENDVNINDQVVVSGNVDTSKEGTYVLVYEVSINGKIKELKRVVKVVNRSLLIEFTPSTEEYTNEDIELSINVTGEKFDYIELPDGNKVYETSTKMTLSESNIYTFTAYNKEEVPFVYTFDAFMIDKEEPEGVCTATVFNDHTEVEVEATDNGEILEYDYLDNKTSFIKVDENKVSYPKKTGKEIYVDIIDKEGNSYLNEDIRRIIVTLKNDGVRRLYIVGFTNSGKSTFINHILTSLKKSPTITTSSIPDTKNQIIFSKNELALPPLRISLPNGQNASPAILKH